MLCELMYLNAFFVVDRLTLKYNPVVIYEILGFRTEQFTKYAAYCEVDRFDM